MTKRYPYSGPTVRSGIRSTSSGGIPQSLDFLGRNLAIQLVLSKIAQNLSSQVRVLDPSQHLKPREIFLWHQGDLNELIVGSPPRLLIPGVALDLVDDLGQTK